MIRSTLTAVMLLLAGAVAAHAQSNEQVCGRGCFLPDGTLLYQAGKGWYVTPPTTDQNGTPRANTNPMLSPYPNDVPPFNPNRPNQQGNRRNFSDPSGMGSYSDRYGIDGTYNYSRSRGY